jgi:uncharacterized protein
MRRSALTRRLWKTWALLRGLPLYLFQERLLFPRHTLRTEDGFEIARQHPQAEAIRIDVGDRASLRGWLVRPAATAPTPLLIYFPGNADDVSEYIGQQQRLGEHALLLMNYRGYGHSSGKPSERALLEDSLRIFDAMSARDDIDGRRIAVLGRSLGSGVAVYLAAQRPVSKVILTTPYDSIAAVAQARYPHIPIRSLLRHQFDSLSRVSKARQPALFLVADSDDVIPTRHATTLYDSWQPAKTWLMLPGTNHADIVDHPRYWQSIARFLDSPAHQSEPAMGEIQKAGG